jgi:transposase
MIPLYSWGGVDDFYPVSWHTAVMVPASLPDLDRLDSEALKALVIAMHSESLEQHKELMSNTHEIEHLKLVIEKYRWMIFGRKSEKLTGELEQLEFRLEELETAQAVEDVAEAAQPPATLAASKRRSRPARKPLPEDLPREVVTHLPPHNCCPDCGGSLRQFGEDVSEQLERIPATFKVIRHVRPKFACAGCERVVEAPAPARPIDRGLPGPGLLAHVLVSKYGDHLPLYRQSQIFAREGVDLDRSTLAGWVGAASELLAPLVDEIRKHVLAASKIHADDTPVPVLAPGNGKTKTGRLWTYVRDDRPAGYSTAPAVWFTYSEDRKGEHPQRHLKDFKGALQADAYSGFHHLYGNGAIYELACWAHTRRKFHDIHVVHASPTTTEALVRIGALYGIEEEIRGKPAEIRRSVRQARAKPLLDYLRHWMEKTLRSLSTKSETAGAIRHALSHWRALTRYLDNGLLEIDNNAAERALRAVAIGRKNYLFMGADSGGKRAASVYSLIGTAKLNGLDPAFYLRTVLATIAEHPINRIQDLLPWNIAASIQADSSQAA